MTTDQKLKLLQDTYNDWAECERCGLCAPSGRTRRHVVFGEGSVDALLLVVGDKPGENDDATGRPFSGDFGEVINQFCRHLTLDREDIFLTNVVGCYPTVENQPHTSRSPLAKEVQACLPRVHRIIEIVDPSVVLLLGKTALTALTEHKSLTALAKAVDKPGIAVITPGRQMTIRRLAYATHHPEYLLQRWDLSPNGVVQQSYQMWRRAIQTADIYNHVLNGIEPPDRGDD